MPLLLTGGTVIDPAAGTSRQADVLVDGGRIAAVGEVRRAPGETVPAMLNVTGAYVAPGFTDIHAHVFHHGLFPAGPPADDVGVWQGVACLFDAGSFGHVTADGFAELVVRRARTRVYGLIHIAAGLPRTGEGHSSRVEYLSLDGTVRAIERHREWIKGVKVQASVSHVGALDTLPVKLARKAAELTGLPLMVHVGNAPPLLEDVLDLLRPGDVVTHAAHGKTGGILGYRGALLPAVRAAMERGVRFDVGHGASSFSFAVAERALAQGFRFDTISTDIHRRNIGGPVFSLAHTMSKLMLLGMPLVEVVRAVTLTPARLFRVEEELGRLEPGRPAHLTVFRLEKGAFELVDAARERRAARHLVRPTHVLVGGELFTVGEP